jgi:hypothetical protein
MTAMPAPMVAPATKKETAGLLFLVGIARRELAMLRATHSH